MSNLKFRQFDKRLNDFMFFELHNGRVHIINSDIESFDVDRKDSPQEQFTGFQDSKGNDIYEGDIIYVAGFSRKAKAIITHEHGSEFEDLDGCHRSMINAAAENDIGEIVGNLHQKPELLEQNK